MKFTKTILTIAALFAVNTITPATYKDRAREVAADPIKYSIALSALEQYVRDEATTLKEQLTTPNQRRNAIGGLLIQAMELGIPENDIESDIMTCLGILKLNATDTKETDKLLGLMLFQSMKNQR